MDFIALIIILTLVFNSLYTTDKCLSSKYPFLEMNRLHQVTWSRWQWAKIWKTSFTFYNRRKPVFYLCLAISSIMERMESIRFQGYRRGKKIWPLGIDINALFRTIVIFIIRSNGISYSMGLFMDSQLLLKLALDTHLQIKVSYLQDQILRKICKNEA